jgi:hypothetical protein
VTETDDYATRVRALEDALGIPTSDAQAMVDAEELLKRRAAAAESADES